MNSNQHYPVMYNSLTNKPESEMHDLIPMGHIIIIDHLIPMYEKIKCRAGEFSGLWSCWMHVVNYVP